MKAGDRVRHMEQPELGFGTIKLVDLDPLDDREILHVAFDWRDGTLACSREMLRQVATLERSALLRPEDVGSLDEIRTRVGAALILSENARTAGFTRSFITPLPHQAYLLEKVHSQRHFGHLIADDVGMGKTIEAGLILAAERRANPSLRVLILCPKNVLLQWQDEMLEHFGLNFKIARHDFSIRRSHDWEGIPLVIASRDGLKQERYREVLREIPPFDLVIVDEAHGLTAKRDFLSGELATTANYRFARWLSDEHIVTWEEDSQGAPRSPRFLFLSATPHQGDDTRFLHLLALVRPDLVDSDDVTAGEALNLKILNSCVSRTPKKRAVDWEGRPIFKGHESRTLEITPTDAERHVLEMLGWYVRERMQFLTAGRADALVRALAMHSYQKIATSSWRALEHSLVSRMAGRLLAEDEDDEAATEFDLLSGEREIEAIQQVLALVRALDHDTKAAEFVRLMDPESGFRRADEKVLVFTQYRSTQTLLQEICAAHGMTTAIINGSLSIDERQRQRALFEESADLMISTEAGSEGANLQRKCHHLINYDSPWNPMRLLQRIGRLDRYGQKHRVRSVTLRNRGTWDDRISERINERLLVIQQAMGQLAEDDYWEMIIGEVYEGLDAAVLMADSDWNPDAPEVTAMIDDHISKVRTDRNRFKKLLNDSLGMPEGFEDRRPILSSNEFQLAFQWAAAAESVRLHKSRTQENQNLPGVFHFTLPQAFRQLLRAGRECHLVFDRERYAEIRNMVLGRVRGQEIKPTLAGLGEPVTDWFFKRAISTASDASVYRLQAPAGSALQGKFWLVFIARWRLGALGPDLLIVIEVEDNGNVIREVPPSEIFETLNRAEGVEQEGVPKIPDLTQARQEALKILRAILERFAAVDRANLRFGPWLMAEWS